MLAVRSVRRPGAKRGLAALLIALAAALGAVGPAQAAEQPPWRAATEIDERLFDAQAAILLDERAEAAGDARAARRALRGPLVTGLEANAPVALADARAALARTERAAAAEDPIALAAARGELRTALLRGAAIVAAKRAGAGDARGAREWLLLREFRKATRLTRPGSDATVALRDLARGKLEAPAARLAVRKDLSDAYQARLALALEAAEKAAGKGFDARTAETTAQARGYWKILAPEYARQRGPAATAAAAAAFDELARAGAEGDAAALKAARARIDTALDAFVAAPFTEKEQTRRAGQLLRFLELIPFEYKKGVDDGKVTIPFEIQEAIAFRDGAESAFADLEGALRERDRASTARVDAGLKSIKTVLADAHERRAVSSEDDVEDAVSRIEDDLDATMPEEWKKATDESDFDLIAISLDRVQSAARAGRWQEAEQARLEAYAFVEFGPELKLRPFDPQLALEIENLIWYGAAHHDGLAKLIADRSDAAAFTDTRTKLDEDLRDAQATLGDGGSQLTAVTNSAIIVFREGLEAVLIFAAVTAGLLGAARSRRPIIIGAALGGLASVLTFVAAQTLLHSLSRYGEKLEAITGLVAIAVLLLVMNWFFHKVYWTKYISAHHKRRKRVMAEAAGGFFSAQILGLALLGFTSVFREGFETVLFLQALQLQAGTPTVLEGTALGLLGVAAVGFIMFFLQRKLPYKRLLVITGVLLGIVLVTMTGQTVRTLQGVGWIPITPVDLEVPAWASLWLGIFPTVETLGAQLAAAVFVVASYIIAEEVRVRRPRRKAKRTLAEERANGKVAPEVGARLEGMIEGVQAGIGAAAEEGQPNPEEAIASAADDPPDRKEERDARPALR